MPVQAGRAVAPGSPAFELHTLGWRAFQDLCAAVVRTVWGQSAHAFADSNDGGRDGAFYGIWHNPPDARGPRDLPDGPFVLQCKHTKKPGGTLSESAWRTSSPRSRRWSRRGLCRSYVLMTNARVTGNAEARIRNRLRRRRGAASLVLDGQWVCDTIAMHQKLRLFVPRVYGLGDLSQILDERAYEQASVLLEAARDQVAAFVITEPYRKAAQALADARIRAAPGRPGGRQVGHRDDARARRGGQLGLPDGQGPDRQRAGRLTGTRNEPDQFFWVDDAFGAVRHEEQLTQDWARSMPHVIAAIGKGARVVLTSRTTSTRKHGPC